MIIEWTLFWAWRNALTTDAAKRPLPKKRPWPAMIIVPKVEDEDVCIRNMVYKDTGSVVPCDKCTAFGAAR